MSFWGGAILLTIFIVSVVAVYLSGKELLLGSDSLSDEVPSSSSTFAIMVENDDGDYEEYTESETWPSGMVFNSSMSFCEDKDGTKIATSLTYNNGYATLTSSDTSYCWLYFRNYGTTATLETIKVVLSSGTTYTCTSTSCTYTAGSGDTSFYIYADTADGSYATFYFSNDTSSIYSDAAVSNNYTLTAGSTTTATVKVTSEDGNTSKSYTIKVTKSDGDSSATITASTGTWSSTCSGTTTSCTLTLSTCSSTSSSASVTLTATASSENATLSWSSKSVTVSCNSSTSTTLTVTADDGSTTTYTVKVAYPYVSTTPYCCWSNGSVTSYDGSCSSYIINHYTNSDGSTGSFTSNYCYSCNGESSAGIVSCYCTTVSGSICYK